MLDIAEIDNTIRSLEEGDTTFSNCQKLAALYTVKQFYQYEQYEEPVDEVTEELDDILPMYTRYCDIKRKYQLNELTQEAVLEAVESVCKEIAEFIQTLYSSTDLPQERENIQQMLKELQQAYQ